MNTQEFPISDVVPALVEARGALDFDSRTYRNKAAGPEAARKDGQGLSPRRLPDWTRMQVPQVMDVIVRMPSGVRLRFNTTATRVGLNFLATNLVNAGKERRDICFNLEVVGQFPAVETDADNGSLLTKAVSAQGNAIHLDPRQPGEYQLQRGSADTIWFDNLPSGNKCCELWLPHNAFIELRSLLFSEELISEELLGEGASLTAPDADRRPRWLHYGSSISHCMEADEPAFTWPAVAARLANANLQSLGFGGQCHLDQFVARTIRDSDADAVSLKVGINVINMDSMRERVFVSALHGFLDTVREGKPETPIALISPIFCPSAEETPGPTLPDAAGKFVTTAGHEKLREGCLTLTRTRTLIREVVKQRNSAGDSKLSYLNGLSLFGADDQNDLPDDLHPNAGGYIRMGQRFAPTLMELLRQA